MLVKLLSGMRAARPGMQFVTRAIVEAIFLSEGSIGSADRVALSVGLRTRYQLARLLRRDGMPALHRLAAWATVLAWVQAAEDHGVSLCRLACRSHRYPSACYRLVRELTGLAWEQVRARGSGWVERQFIKELRAHRWRNPKRECTTPS